MRPFCPVIEPKTAKDPFLTEEPLDIIKSGRYNKVPMIMGYNSFEGIFFYNYIKHPKNKFLHDFGMVPSTLNLRIGSPSFKIVAEKVRKVYDIKGHESKEVADDLRKALKVLFFTGNARCTLLFALCSCTDITLLLLTCTGQQNYTAKITDTRYIFID